MKRLLLAAAALGGLTALTTSGAMAAPFVGIHVAPTQPAVTQVDYYWHRHHWHRHHWHHRRWHHHHRHYWN